jgi:hypothetical protein
VPVHQRPGVRRYNKIFRNSGSVWNIWWSWRELNPRPPLRQRGALPLSYSPTPTSITAHIITKSAAHDNARARVLSVGSRPAGSKEPSSDIAHDWRSAAKGIGRVLCIVILSTSAAAPVAAEVRAYPGAHRDQQVEPLVNADPKNHGVQSVVYLTPDPFERAHEFYKAIGTEDATMKKDPASQLPGGGAIDWALFTFDGAKSICSST